MSTVGPSPTLPTASPAPPSHTSTDQWQSFEFRMRHRRAYRCLLRAEMALEAGFEDDAREALDEAERLNSGSPQLAALRAVLEERATASMVAYRTTQQAAQRQRVRNGAAVAMIVLTVGVGAFWVTRTNSPAVEMEPARAALAALDALDARAGTPSPVAASPRAPRTTPPVAADAKPLDAPAAIATAGKIDVQTPEPAVHAGARATGNGTSDAKPQPGEITPRLPEFNPQFADPRPLSLPPSSSLDPAALRGTPPSVPDPAPTIPDAPAPAALSAGLLDGMGERLPTANVPAERRAAPENPATLEEPRVRAALSRYEAAYSGLDASAAQAVWPGVDERSLARAFDTLQSQRVSLGRCSVQVEGATANASCSGSITWTPKVGGGSQTAARQWRFELASGNGGWQIARAEVR